MRLLIPFVAILICLTTHGTIKTAETSEPERYSVCSLTSSNFEYSCIKESGDPLTYPKNEETFITKAEICMGIIRSEWMDVYYHLNAVNMHDEAVYDELEEKYPSIFAKFYTIRSSSSKTLEFENPYRLRNIVVKDDRAPEDADRGSDFILEEYVYSCLARNRRSGKIEEYFISPKYKFRYHNDELELRFIFCYDKTGNMVPHAMALPYFGSERSADEEFEEELRAKDTAMAYVYNSLRPSRILDDLRNESVERRRRVTENLRKPNAVLLSILSARLK